MPDQSPFRTHFLVKSLTTAGRVLGVVLAFLLAAPYEADAESTGAPKAETSAEAPAPAPIEESDEAEATQLAPTKKINYTTDIAITDDSNDISDLLSKLSKLKSMESQPPFSVALLHKRAAQDLKLLEKALRSEGYYDSQLDYAIDESGGIAADYKVRVSVDPGPAYNLSKFDIQLAGPGAGRNSLSDTVAATVPSTGVRAQAKLVPATETQLLTQFAQVGFPEAFLRDRRVVVDHTSRTMMVTITIDTGPEVVLGPLSVGYLENVDLDFVTRQQTWQKGDLFDQRKIDSFKSALYKSGLFKTVNLTYDTATLTPTSKMRTVSVDFYEAKQRSVGVGLVVSSSDGFGGNAYWEHRNLLGQAEILAAEVNATTLEQNVGLRFTKPRFLRPSQKLRLSVTGGREDSDAYTERAFRLGAGIDRPAFGKWKLSLDAEAELLNVEQNNVTDTFELFSITTKVSRDTANDPLNPTKGSRIALSGAPHLSLGSGTTPYMVFEASGATYRAVFDDRVVLAARARFGSIVGAKNSNIPASQRFFSGGGRSVRGYDYQSIGPLDDSDDPLGGRSVAEINLEPRIKITPKFSLIPFIDAGIVSTDELPDFSNDVQVGAGLGVAYQTPVGPIRLDLARAVNRRSNVDGVIEFYISLGQAF